MPTVSRDQLMALYQQIDPGKTGDVNRILSNLGTNMTLSQLQGNADLSGLTGRSSTDWSRILSSLQGAGLGQSGGSSFAPNYIQQGAGGYPAYESMFSPSAMNQMAQFYQPYGAGPQSYQMMGYNPAQAQNLSMGYSMGGTANTPFMMNQVIPMMLGMGALPYQQSMWNLGGLAQQAGMPPSGGTAASGSAQLPKPTASSGSSAPKPGWVTIGGKPVYVDLSSGLPLPPPPTSNTQQQQLMQQASANLGALSPQALQTLKAQILAPTSSYNTTSNPWNSAILQGAQSL
jgi:hypothetical protein